MTVATYNVGDTIYLKTDTFDKANKNNSAVVLQVQPESQGRVRYRIRFTSENFDRTVAEEDIDNSLSLKTIVSREDESSTNTTGSWINQTSIRTKK